MCVKLFPFETMVRQLILAVGYEETTFPVSAICLIGLIFDPIQEPMTMIVHFSDLVHDFQD